MQKCIFNFFHSNKRFIIVLMRLRDSQPASVYNILQFNNEEPQSLFIARLLRCYTPTAIRDESGVVLLF